MDPDQRERTLLKRRDFLRGMRNVGLGAGATVLSGGTAAIIGYLARENNSLYQQLEADKRAAEKQLNDIQRADQEVVNSAFQQGMEWGSAKTSFDLRDARLQATAVALEDSDTVAKELAKIPHSLIDRAVKITHVMGRLPDNFKSGDEVNFMGFEGSAAVIEQIGDNLIILTVKHVIEPTAEPDQNWELYQWRGPDLIKMVIPPNHVKVVTDDMVDLGIMVIDTKDSNLGFNLSRPVQIPVSPQLGPGTELHVISYPLHGSRRLFFIPQTFTVTSVNEDTGELTAASGLLSEGGSGTVACDNSGAIMAVIPSISEAGVNLIPIRDRYVNLLKKAGIR